MKTLVILEDDRRVATLWTETLEDAGYRIVHETHADAALAAVHRTEADLVIADLLIRQDVALDPRRGGLSLINELRSLNPPPKRPVILAVTGMQQSDRLPRYLDSLGADATLIKPVDPEELLRWVQLHLP